jgi:hypothetical protein
MYKFKYEYNNACNCHPEYSEVELQSESLPELFRMIAASMTEHHESYNYVDPSDVTKSLSDEELAEAKQAYEDAYPEIERVQERQRRKTALRDEMDRAASAVRKAEQDFNTLFDELSVGARENRTRRIEQLKGAYNLAKQRYDAERV